ncbi:MAG: transaldolase [Bacteroidales bacterium]|nr:transaldolase [Bacteroidales bacterium]
MADLNTRISDYIWKNLNERHANAKKDPFWESLRNTGTEIWLDTGDIAEAEANWTSEMSALTTNNTLLNNEIQKGEYDIYISEAKSLIRELPPQDRIKEVAFIINARHGLRLATKFGGFVSVELHTDTAHDVNAIVHYGKRFHEICPDQFIIKVPFTAEGLIGARKLMEAGISVNFTLDFSARQNILATRVAMPAFLNVFVGRIGAFMIYNKLGDGTGVGERAVVASQNWVTALSANNPWQTKLIVASLRHYSQVEMLAGADVFTIPPAVAAEARRQLSGNFSSRMHEHHEVSLFSSASEARIEKFWEADNNVFNLAERLSAKLPSSAQELIQIAHEEGCGDMFPFLTREEKANISSDGKIPVYTRWAKKIKEGEIAPDTLLTLAGLASFTADQKMLDERIRSIIE